MARTDAATATASGTANSKAWAHMSSLHRQLPRPCRGQCEPGVQSVRVSGKITSNQHRLAIALYQNGCTLALAAAADQRPRIATVAGAGPTSAAVRWQRRG